VQLIIHTNYEEKKLKQWWSTIPSISTKWTPISHLSSHKKDHNICIWRWKSRSWL